MTFLLLLLSFQSSPAPTPPALPSFVLFGGNAAASTTPKPGGFGCYGTPIASDKESWSCYQGTIMLVAGKPVTSTSATTGIAQRVAKFSLGSWNVQGWINGALGPGTVGATTSLALNASGGVTFFRKSWVHPFGWLGYQQSQIAGKSGGQVQVAWGWRL